MSVSVLGLVCVFFCVFVSVLGTTRDGRGSGGVGEDGSALFQRVRTERGEGSPSKPAFGDSSLPLPSSTTSLVLERVADTGGCGGGVQKRVTGLEQTGSGHDGGLQTTGVGVSTCSHGKGGNTDTTSPLALPIGASPTAKEHGGCRGDRRRQPIGKPNAGGELGCEEEKAAGTKGGAAGFIREVEKAAMDGASWLSCCGAGVTRRMEDWARLGAPGHERAVYKV